MTPRSGPTIRCTGCPPRTLRKLLGIDEHQEEEHQHQHGAGVDDDLSGGQELRAEHDEDARGVEQRQHQEDGGMDRDSWPRPSRSPPAPRWRPAGRRRSRSRPSGGSSRSRPQKLQLAVADQPDERGDQDVDQHQRQQHLPGDAHQLVVAETGQGAAQPDVEEEEERPPSAGARGCPAPSSGPSPARRCRPGTASPRRARRRSC